MNTILVVDDEASVRESIRMILEYAKYTVLYAESGAKALSTVREQPVDAVLLDIKMPGKDGIEVLREMKEVRPELPVVMVSGHGTVETAVEATKLGAYDFLPKPLDRDKLLITVRNALDHGKLAGEVRRLRGRELILGSSAKIKEILGLIERVAPTDARVLITGESGTGKELVAKAIHRQSRRAGGPFVEVNCAAIPGELIESELFGHEKGSFTGATAQRIGKFEQADGGTIFLDEVGDMSIAAQAKVLRVIEEGKVERVGGNKMIPVEVRVIAATNKNLPEEIKRQTFREDLYHRLNVIPIHVPPLRERREDIPLLVEAFLKEICERNGMAVRKVAPPAMDALVRQEWSGNVRELRNIVERLVIMSPGTVIESAEVQTLGGGSGGGGGDRGGDVSADDIVESSQTFQEYKERAEAMYLKHQLELHGWNVSKTAEAVEMERSHLYTKIKKYGLGRGDKEGE